MRKRPRIGGVYALIIQMRKQERIRIGSLGSIAFALGVYLYIGSAMNSLEGRISRHFRTDKREHWHVDYLLGRPGIRLVGVAVKRGGRRVECSMSRAVEKKAVSSVRRFGSSDCNCYSHLHHLRDLKIASKVLSEVGFVQGGSLGRRRG